MFINVHIKPHIDYASVLVNYSPCKIRFLSLSPPSLLHARAHTPTHPPTHPHTHTQLIDLVNLLPVLAETVSTIRDCIFFFATRRLPSYLATFICNLNIYIYR